MPLKIIIVGCGLGGLAAALSLQYYSEGRHRIILVERAELISEVGAGLTIMPNGMKIMRRFMDFEAAGLGDSSPGGGADLDLRTGQIREDAMKTSVASEVEKRGGWLHVHRGDLQAVILGEVQRICGDNLEIHTGAKVTKVDAETGVITLENGRTMQGDLILGADGVKSACRTTVAPEKDTLVTAAYAYRFQLDADLFNRDERLAPLMRRHNMYSTGPYRMVVYPIRKGSIANVVILCPPSLFSAQEIGWSIPTSHEEVITNLNKAPGGVCEEVTSILQLMKQHAEVKTWRIADREVLDKYAFGRLALLGDAAHAMTPSLGQGVNMAIEDAAVLGSLLANVTPEQVPEALQHYSKLRAPRAGAVQLVSRLAVTKDFQNSQLPTVDERHFLTVADFIAWAWDKDVLEGVRG